MSELVKRVRVRNLKEGEEFTCIEFIRVRVKEVGSMEVVMEDLTHGGLFTRHQFSTLPISLETLPERFQDVRD